MQEYFFAGVGLHKSTNINFQTFLKLRFSIQLKINCYYPGDDLRKNMLNLIIMLKHQQQVIIFLRFTKRVYSQYKLLVCLSFFMLLSINVLVRQFSSQSCQKLWMMFIDYSRVVFFSTMIRYLLARPTYIISFIDAFKTELMFNY